MCDLLKGLQVCDILGRNVCEGVREEVGDRNAAASKKKSCQTTIKLLIAFSCLLKCKKVMCSTSDLVKLSLLSE